jgi:nitrogen fixation NifU-like protein
MMMTKGEDMELPEELEDLEALQGVKKYPVRIKCALLPWNTLLQGIETADGQPAPQ